MPHWLIISKFDVRLSNSFQDIGQNWTMKYRSQRSTIIMVLNTVSHWFIIWKYDIQLSVKLPEKSPEDQAARQDPGHRSPEENRDAKRAYSFEACAAQVD